MLSRYAMHRRGLAVVAAGLLAAACGDPTVRYVGEPQAGPRGPAGPEGPQGAVGAQGATGATGAKGTTSAPPRNRGSEEVVLAAPRDLANGLEDPYFTHLIVNAWNSLSKLDNNLVPQPELAESWESNDDATVWTIKLRSGITFQDGEVFDAGAVAANIERYVQISPRSSRYFSYTKERAMGEFEKVEAVDTSTVRLTLGRPRPALPNTMSNFYSAMFSPASFTAEGNFNAPPASAGPFKIVEWVKGQHLILEAFENYHRGAPAVKQLTIRSLPDPNTRVAALRSGEIDGVVDLGGLQPQQGAQLRDEGALVVNSRPIALQQYLSFNNKKPPFDKLEMRQAVNMAIDRQSLAKDLWHGFATPGGSILPAFADLWVRKDLVAEYNPQKALELAKAAMGGQRMKIDVPISALQNNRYPYKSLHEVIQAVIAPLGLDADLQLVEHAAWKEIVKNGDYHLTVSTHGWANGDPDYLFSRFMHSKGDTNAQRHFDYNDPEIDKLVVQAASSLDYNERKALYDRLQEIAFKDVRFATLLYDHVVFAHHPALEGYDVSTLYQPSLSQLSVR